MCLPVTMQRGGGREGGATGRVLGSRQCVQRPWGSSVLAYSNESQEPVWQSSEPGGGVGAESRSRQDLWDMEGTWV